MSNTSSSISGSISSNSLHCHQYYLLGLSSRLTSPPICIQIRQALRLAETLITTLATAAAAAVVRDVLLVIRPSMAHFSARLFHAALSHHSRRKTQRNRRASAAAAAVAAAKHAPAVRYIFRTTSSSRMTSNTIGCCFREAAAAACPLAKLAGGSFERFSICQCRIST